MPLVCEVWVLCEVWADGWTEGWVDGWVVCEVWAVKPRFYKDEVFKVGGGWEKVRGEYRV